MHRTGRYKTINAVFGWLPFIGATMIATMREDSNPYRSWLSIVGALVVLAWFGLKNH
jgi:hypothetical protein